MNRSLIYLAALGVLVCAWPLHITASQAERDQSSCVTGGFDHVGVEARPIEGKCPMPDYPEKALRKKVKGLVHVAMHIDTTGHVIEWKIQGEKPEGYGFGKAAVKAIKEWEFVPAMTGGIPVETWIAVPFKFRPPIEAGKPE